MKFRIGFVTNSSSTAYISVVTGEMISGRNIDISDWGWAMCVNGHAFETKYLIESNVSAEEKRAIVIKNVEGSIVHYGYHLAESKPGNVSYWQSSLRERREELARTLVMDDDEIDEVYKMYNEDGVPAHQCPGCTLAHMSDADVLEYLLNTLNLERDDICGNMREMFASSQELRKWLNAKQESESQPAS